jgi:hypothetical protein
MDGRGPAWSTYRQALVLCLQRSTLRRTIPVALIVGAMLTGINLGGEFLNGDATPAMWVRAGLNFIVPFVVSTIGFLSATRSRP